MGAEATQVLYRNPNLVNVFGPSQDSAFEMLDLEPKEERVLVEIVQLFLRTISASSSLAFIVRGLKLPLVRAFELDPADLRSILDELPRLYSLVLNRAGESTGIRCPEWVPVHSLHLSEFQFDGFIPLLMFANHPHLRYLSASEVRQGNLNSSNSQEDGYQQLVSFQLLDPWYPMRKFPGSFIKHLSISSHDYARLDDGTSIPLFPNLVNLRIKIDSAGKSLATVLRMIYNLAVTAPDLQFLWVDFVPPDSYIIPLTMVRYC